MADDPDLQFSGFSRWVDRREFPESLDYWDSNWLMIRARMEALGALIECSGPILMTTDIREFRDRLVAMIETLDGEASLKGLEPELEIVLRMKERGHVEGIIEITADHLNQHHRFKVEADQSYLPALLQSCDAILQRYPVANAGTEG